MAKREVHDCDSCGKEIKGDPISVGIVTGRYSDGAGDMDDEFNQVDLCRSCGKRELRLFVHDLTHEQAREWIQRVGKNGSFWLTSIGYVGKR